VKKIIFLIQVLLIQFSVGAQDKSRMDEFWGEPQSTYQQRKVIGLTYIRDNSQKEGLYGLFNQVARVGLGEKVEEEYIQKSLDFIRLNRDCNDFTANGLIRLMYVNKERKIFTDEMSKKIDDCLLDFKYWWDDGRKDSTYRCYHTENHQALYHTAELLAGQLYKDKVFTNGMTGRQHMEHAEVRIERWLDFRFRFGFSEWLSSYYDVEVMLLANLYDYAEDPKIRTRAGMVLDLLMYDMALNNYHGMLGSTSGRIYVGSLIKGSHQMSPVTKLVFGVGRFRHDNEMGVVSLALSSYKCPQIIQDIAVDYSKTYLNKQRVSIEVDDAPKYGLSFDNELDVHLFWGMQEFIHPQVVEMSKKMSEKYGTWPYNGKSYNDYINRYKRQIEEHGKIVNNRFDRFALSEANIMTYKTPDYMLSSVQDYRKGAVGYQQHIWQATFGNEALVFTNSPGSKNLRYSPNYWAGNTYMPRAAQFENVLISVYNIPEKSNPDFTHAYFPKASFDEVIQKENWTFARKNDGYIALYSCQPTQFQLDAEGVENDLVAKGRRNVWICETGSQKQWGNFDKFVKAIYSTPIKCNDLNVVYTSPTQGKISFGWEGDFVVKGKVESLRYDSRFDNHFSKTSFDSKVVEIKNGAQKLILDFEKGMKQEN